MISPVDAIDIRYREYGDTTGEGKCTKDVQAVLLEFRQEIQEEW